MEAWAHTGFVAGAQKNGEHEYFDSIGLPPPNERELELKKLRKKTFLRNDNQLQWIGSVRCGYYCLLFLNERNKGKSFKNILAMFSDNVHEISHVVLIRCVKECSACFLSEVCLVFKMLRMQKTVVCGHVST